MSTLSAWPTKITTIATEYPGTRCPTATLLTEELPPRLELGDHPLDLGRLSPRRSVPQLLQSIHVLGLECLFASLGDQAAFHPHLDAIRDRQIGAFRDEGGSELGVPRTKNFVVEGLAEQSQQEFKT